MSTKNETPLWLELRKEYIDDNFWLLVIVPNQGITLILNIRKVNKFFPRVHRLLQEIWRRF